MPLLKLDLEVEALVLVDNDRDRLAQPISRMCERHRIVPRREIVKLKYTHPIARGGAGSAHVGHRDARVRDGLIVSLVDDAVQSAAALPQSPRTAPQASRPQRIWRNS